MELKLDADKFDEHQAIFIGEIIERIKAKLEEAGLTGEKLKEVTGNIAFSVACTIDDTAGIEFEGTEVNPYLTFLAGDKGSTPLLRTLLKRGTMCQRSVHDQTQKIQ